MWVNWLDHPQKFFRGVIAAPRRLSCAPMALTSVAECSIKGDYGQYIALAVADTFEAAKAAADAVRATYAKEKPNVETHLEADDDPRAGLAVIKTKVYALNFADDEFNPAELHVLEELIPKVHGGRFIIQPGSAESFGHLTMAHPELWSEHVAEFMRSLGDDALQSSIANWRTPYHFRRDRRIREIRSARADPSE
jgi:hypothetical protein